MHFRVLLYAFERISIGCLLALYIKKIFCPSGLAMGQCRLLSEIICICMHSYTGTVHKWCHPLSWKGDLLKAYLVKMGEKGRGQKSHEMGDVIYGWPTLCTYVLWTKKTLIAKTDKTGLSKIRYLGSHLLKI